MLFRAIRPVIHSKRVPGSRIMAGLRRRMKHHTSTFSRLHCRFGVIVHGAISELDALIGPAADVNSARWCGALQR